MLNFAEQTGSGAVIIVWYYLISITILQYRYCTYLQYFTQIRGFQEVIQGGYGWQHINIHLSLKLASFYKYGHIQPIKRKSSPLTAHPTLQQVPHKQPH